MRWFNVTLFKGYIPTKNKKCLQKFKDVKELNTLEDVQNLCKENKIKHTVINKNLGTIQIKINSQEFEYPCS